MKAANSAIRWPTFMEAAFDNPDLIVALYHWRRRSGGQPTGREPAFQQILKPGARRRGAAILHLNGFKIANRTVLARISRQELMDLLHGYGYEPYFVAGDEPAAVYEGERRNWTVMERHKLYVGEHGGDMPVVRDWRCTRCEMIRR